MMDLSEVRALLDEGMRVARDLAPLVAQAARVGTDVAKSVNEQVVLSGQIRELMRALVETQTQLKSNTVAVERCEASNRQMAQQLSSLAHLVEEVRSENRRQDDHLASLDGKLVTVLRDLDDVKRRLNIVETTPPRGTPIPR